MFNTSHRITRPALLVDTERCGRNIDRMITRMSTLGVAFRPHFKTHQSRIIGGWFRDFGVRAITVSSVGMAEYFADAGWDDITIAFPVNLLELASIDALAGRIRLNLLVEDPEVIRQLDRGLTSRVGVFLKIDTGTHRTGLDPHDGDNIDQCIEAIRDSASLTWKGFLAHAGHTYQVRNQAGAIQSIYDHALAPLEMLKQRYRSRYPDILISFGDTPGASRAERLGPVDEMRPGNFVFYDIMQEQIGSCNMEDVSVAMVCPVVAVHPSREECVIYGGGMHFSKDSIADEAGLVSYGAVIAGSAESWNAGHILGKVRSLSQEHGVIRCQPEMMRSVRPGHLLCVLPVHSCMTALCMGRYLTNGGATLDHYATAMWT